MYGEKRLSNSSNSKKNVAVSTLTQTCDALRTQMKIIKKRTHNIGLKITQSSNVSMVDNKSENIRVRKREFTTM